MKKYLENLKTKIKKKLSIRYFLKKIDNDFYKNKHTIKSFNGFHYMIKIL